MKKEELDEILNKVQAFKKMFHLEKNAIIGDISRILDEEFIILKFPNKMNISGTTFNKEDANVTYKCIYINNNDPIGRQNFTLAHELYHIYFEDADIGLCLKELVDDNEIEKRAEIFASNLLIPKSQLILDLKRMGMNNNKEINMNKIFQLQQKYYVSFQAIIYAIEQSYNYDYLSDFFKFIPKIPDYFKKYYNSQWDELEKISLSFDNKFNLNSSNPKYIMPENFKNDIISNYKKGLVDYSEVEDIFNFFEIFCIDELLNG